MRTYWFATALCLIALSWCGASLAVPAQTTTQAQPTSSADDRYASYLKSKATIGPARVSLRDEAVLDLPPGYAFLPEKPAREFMTKIGNQTDDNFRGIVLPQKSSTWFVFVEYLAAGYIKDDDAKNWNADAMLADIRRNTEQGNESRRKAGVPEMEVIGWVEKPHYDAATHRLIWSISARDKGAKNNTDNIINYRTLMLGRQGYVAMVMVTDLATIEAQKPIAKLLLSKLGFASGKRYTDFNASTDHVAEYGLAALIGGVVVHKLGFFALMAAFAAKFFKAIALVVVGVLAAVRKFFRRAKPAAPGAPQIEPGPGPP